MIENLLRVENKVQSININFRHLLSVLKLMGQKVRPTERERERQTDRQTQSKVSMSPTVLEAGTAISVHRRPKKGKGNTKTPDPWLLLATKCHLGM